MNSNGKTLRVIRGARLILPDEVTSGSIGIDNGHIVSIGREPSDAPAEVIDGTNLTVYPGFIDVHIHGAHGVDTMAATGEELDGASVWLASQGVTGWLPTLVPGPVEEYDRAIAAIEKAAPMDHGARVLGVHYEGPFVNTAQCGALRTQFFRTHSRTADIDDLPTLQFPGRHLMTLAPEVVGGIELISELIKRGWIVSLGHTKADFDVLDQALAAGARHMTHFMTAM